MVRARVRLRLRLRARVRVRVRVRVRLGLTLTLTLTLTSSHPSARPPRSSTASRSSARCSASSSSRCSSSRSCASSRSSPHSPGTCSPTYHTASSAPSGWPAASCERRPHYPVVTPLLPLSLAARRRSAHACAGAEAERSMVAAAASGRDFHGSRSSRVAAKAYYYN